MPHVEWTLGNMQLLLYVEKKRIVVEHVATADRFHATEIIQGSH